MKIQLLQIIFHFFRKELNSDTLELQAVYCNGYRKHMTITVKRLIVILCSDIMLVSVQSVETQK